MEGTIAMYTHFFLRIGASAPLPQINSASPPAVWRQRNNTKQRFSGRCFEIRQGKKEVMGEEEWKEMVDGRWGSAAIKCKGEVDGVVELLECLEREAIMGEDQGKEPHDYNRRARIFDRSSRVFQALKERPSISPAAAAGHDPSSQTTPP